MPSSRDSYGDRESVRSGKSFRLGTNLFSRPHSSLIVGIGKRTCTSFNCSPSSIQLLQFVTIVIYGVLFSDCQLTSKSFKKEKFIKDSYFKEDQLGKIEKAGGGAVEESPLFSIY